VSFSYDLFDPVPDLCKLQLDGALRPSATLELKTRLFEKLSWRQSGQRFAPKTICARKWKKFLMLLDGPLKKKNCRHFYVKLFWE
jgi:hypothetical protein